MSEADDDNDGFEALVPVIEPDQSPELQRKLNLIADAVNQLQQRLYARDKEQQREISLALKDHADALADALDPLLESAERPPWLARCLKKSTM